MEVESLTMKLNRSESMAEQDQEFVVANRLGIHAKVAAQIVKVAKQYRSDVWITKKDHTVSGKNLLDVLTLFCPQGTMVRVSASGDDASEAMDALSLPFQTKLGES